MRFRALRSVSYVERLASSPGNRILSTWTLEAPDRFAYRIAGGPAAVVIGGERWDRSGSRWRRTSASPSRQPAPIWGTASSDARIVATRRLTQTLAFMDPRVPAWFRLTVDRRTLRPVALEMTAAAHFMEQQYTAYDAPRRVVPPHTG